MSKNHTIHGLRGLCALMVFVGHVISMSINGGYLKFNEHSTLVLAEIGVDVFFMISGYLIVQSLVKHGKVGQFFYNRFIRIYPVYLPLLVTMFIVGPIIHFDWLANLTTSEYILNFIYGLLMLPGVFPLEEAVRNSRTLSYEFAFYLVSVIFFVSLRPLNNKYVKWILITIGLIISMAVIIRLPRALFFLTGVLAYFLSEKYNFLPSKFYSLLSLIIIYLATYFGDIYFSILLGVFFFYLVIKEQGYLSSVLKTKFFQYFGTLSYSFYLLHPFALFPFQRVMSKFNLPDFVSVSITFVGGLLIATVISHLSYELIENRFTNRFLKRKKISNVPHVPVPAPASAPQTTPVS